MDARWPNFLIIGAAKSGMTSLYRYLRQHPQVHMSPIKEPKYWAFVEHRPAFVGPGDAHPLADWPADYASLFATDPPKLMRGEASVIYLYWPGTAERIARALPAMKCIALLRQPADRAFSHFVMNQRAGFESATFAEALRLEPERQRLGWYPGWFYRDRGYYHRQLARYAAVLPAAQWRAWLYDDLQRDPAQLVREVCEFLEIDSTVPIAVSERHNAGGRVPRAPWLFQFVARHPLTALARHRLRPAWYRALKNWFLSFALAPATLAPELRAELTAGYREDILALQHLINRDLSHWLD